MKSWINPDISRVNRMLARPNMSCEVGFRAVALQILIRLRGDNGDEITYVMESSSKCVPILTKEHFLFNVREAMGNRC